MFAIHRTQSWWQSNAINAVSSKNWVLAFSWAQSAAVKLASHPSNTDIGTHKSPLYPSSSSNVSTCARCACLNLSNRELQTCSQWYSMLIVSYSRMKTDFGWVQGESHLHLFLFWVKHASRQTIASGLSKQHISNRYPCTIIKEMYPVGEMWGNSPPKQIRQCEHR